jgi:cellulose synthase operon protein YhjQ
MALICFASPTGGVGRTTLAANVARELSRAGARVIAVDLDPQNALGMHFGLDLRDAFGFLATLRYAADPRAAWRAALRSSPSGVSFLPYGQLGMDGANATAAALSERPDMLSDALQDMLSVSGVTVVADLPPGPSSTLAAALRHATLLVVPVLPDPSSVAQVPAVEGGRFGGVGSANGFDSKRLRYVINKWGMPGRLAGPIGQGIVQQLTGRLLGAVRYNEAIPEALAAQRLLGDFAPMTDAARDVTGLAAAIAAQIQAFRVPEPVAIMPQARAQTLRNTHPLSSLAEILPGSRPTVAQKANR